MCAMLTVVDHPLVGHLLTELRNRDTQSPVFRTVTRRLTAALVLEATRDLPAEPRRIETPLEETEGSRLGAGLVAVPVLRAGLGMLGAVTELFPGVSVGYIGLERDEQTLRPTSYYEKLPPMDGRWAVLLDPMLATGGTAARACTAIKERGPAEVRMVCVVAAPEGVKAMEESHPDVQVFTASLDRELNEVGYILPGLGDFGDRLYDTPPG
ncbi:MAG TPA: uracil phosphoribosyltransferase [Actinomycetota bacterium]|nr:uracil phosphoribosyltransferase [Actinomycetota bacterium]